MEWKPINTAPFDTPILVFGYWRRWGGDDKPRMAVWERDSRYKGDPLEFYSGSINGDVTHWAPLPEAPSDTAVQDGVGSATPAR